MKLSISFELNGYATEAEIEPHLTLLDMLRDVLGETGTKEGCREGECGACTVIIDGKAVNACLFPGPEADGTKIVTIEGLTTRGGELSAIQEAFVDLGGTQCGFCTPGMVMSTVALLSEKPSPSDSEIRHALTGNLCRCTGYVQIVDSVQSAATRMRREAHQ